MTDISAMVPNLAGTTTLRNGSVGAVEWTGYLFKGTAASFDEGSTPLSTPAFLTDEPAEATYYAASLEGDGDRRVMRFAAATPLRLLVLPHGTRESREMLRSYGASETSPPRMARDLIMKGFDGVALDGGNCFHIVLADIGKLVHMDSTPLSDHEAEVVPPACIR